MKEKGEPSSMKEKDYSVIGIAETGWHDSIEWSEDVFSSSFFFFFFFFFFFVDGTVIGKGRKVGEKRRWSWNYSVAKV